jgi:hypothetical protein
VFVATGDVTGDGRADVIAGAGTGGPPVVRVFSLAGGAALVTSFNSFAPNFTGGVRVATGDINGDGIDEILTGAGPGGPGEIRLFGLNGNDVLEIGRGAPFGGVTTPGVFVAAGDVNGDGRAEIIAGLGAGGGPHVRAFDIAGGVREVANFFAFEPNFLGGVTVAAGDVDGDGLEDIIAGTGPGRPSQVRAFPVLGNQIGVNLYTNVTVFPQSYLGGVFVGAH